MRRCLKATCSEPASATVAMRYTDRLVWLRDLLPERDPNFLELCSPHADRMTVPVGWTRLDERAAASPEPEAAPVEEAAPEVPAAEPVPVAAADGALVLLG